MSDPAEPSEPALFRRLLDAAPDATVVVDAQGLIVFANQRTEEVFGYPREELLGREIEVLIPQRFRGAHGQHRAHYAQAPNLRPMGSGLELYGCKRDGSEFPLEISLSPLATDRGLLVSASIRDISDRKQHEQKLRRIQEHLLSAVESIQGAFAIFDAQERAVLCNSTFQLLVGQPLERPLVGERFDAILDANIRAGVFDPAAIAGGELRAKWIEYHSQPQPVGALDLRTQDGRILRVVERRTAEGGTVALITDVSDDVTREDELRHARELAEAASSAKSEFLASMSHELRTPLNAVLGFAQLLQRDKKAPLSPRQQERVGHVLKGGSHLLRLIDEVLDLSRIEAGSVTVSLEPVSLTELIAEVVTTLETLATPVGVQLSQQTSSSTRVVADRTRLRQILMNFGSNAIKYGRKHGKVNFAVSSCEGYTRISVIDDGIGIPRSKQDKIFQPFQRAGQETGMIEGTGIGLAITKRLAALMHGHVGFESEEGKGSSFWIDLPVPKIEVETAVSLRVTNGEALALAAEGPSYMVVYVEDNPSNIAFMEDMLADFDRVQLLTAPTAEIGLALIRARQPNAVIMDINLPGISGLEAMKQLQQAPETRHIPVIALSAAAMVQDAKRVSSAGFYRYLTKPVQVDELMQVLEELLVREESAG